jgi:methylmalonyl-CoA/ethylmalonyl-CoA epimerase
MKLPHIGLAARNLEESTGYYRAILGIHCSTPATEDENLEVRVVFAQVSENVFIEFIEPTSDDSPVRRLVAQGGGFYHFCYEVEHLDEALEKAKFNGALIIKRPVPAGAFERRRIAFLMMPDCNIFELLEEGYDGN